jgi:mannosyltransferase
VKRPRCYLFLAAFVALGVLLRVYDLAGESLWRDEVWSIDFARLDIPHLLDRLRSFDVHPPLYYLLLHYWLILWGESEFATRMLSVLFGSLAIIWSYLVAARLFNPTVGVFTALLVTTSEFQVYYAQEARGYSLVAFLTLLSYFFFSRCLQDKYWTAKGGYVIATVLLLYTHVYGLFTVLAQNMYWTIVWLCARRQSYRRGLTWVLLQSIVLLLYAPWLSATLAQTVRVQQGFWVERPTLFSVVSTLSTYSGSRLSFFIFLIAALIATFPTLKEKLHRLGEKQQLSSLFLPLPDGRLSTAAAILLLVTWLFLPLLLPLVISQFMEPIYLTRCTIGASLAWYILLAKGIESTRSKPSIQAPFVGVLFLCSTVNLWQYYTKSRKEQWREVTRYIEYNAAPGDLVLFYAGLCQAPFDYYAKRPDLIKKSVQDFSPEGDATAQVASVLKGANGQVWLVLCEDWKRRKGLVQMLHAVFPALSHQRYVGIDLLRMKSSSATAAQ